MREHDKRPLQYGGIRRIFGAMERLPKFKDTNHPLPDGDLAAEMLGAWAEACSSSGLPRQREIDPRRFVHSMASMQQSGFAYPGIVGGIQAGGDNGADDPKGDRNASSDFADQA